MPKQATALTDKYLRGEVARFEKIVAQKKHLADGGCTGLVLLIQKTGGNGISKRWFFRATVGTIKRKGRCSRCIGLFFGSSRKSVERGLDF